MTTQHVLGDFSTWLGEELHHREWSQADLSRKTGISRAHISRIMRQENPPGVEFCKKIAQAFGMDESEVLQAAGLLSAPRRTAGDTWIDRFQRLLPFLTSEDKDDLIAMAEAKIERKRRKG